MALEFVFTRYYNDSFILTPFLTTHPKKVFLGLKKGICNFRSGPISLLAPPQRVTILIKILSL